jgi:hypothetical protein
MFHIGPHDNPSPNDPSLRAGVYMRGEPGMGSSFVRCFFFFTLVDTTLGRIKPQDRKKYTARNIFLNIKE